MKRRVFGLFLGLGLGCAAAQGAFQGTVTAPAGGDVYGTLVIACAPSGGDSCNPQLTRHVQLTQGGGSASFEIRGLQDGQYLLFAWQDVNGNGTIEDGEPLAYYSSDGIHPGFISPPAAGVTLAFRGSGTSQTTQAAAPPTTPPTSSAITFPEISVEAGVVAGRLVDTRGQPIAGARIWVMPALTTGNLEIRSDADGAYYVRDLPSVPYTVKAWTTVDYNGQRFCLRLGHPNVSDYDAFSPSMGAVRNFVWQLTGPIPDREGSESYGAGFFGATIQLYQEVAGDRWLEGGEQVELQLTPTGPLIDGSTGSPLTRTVTYRPREAMYALDIPVGTYNVSATLIEPSGTRTPIHVGTEYGGERSLQAPIAFEAADGCSYESGVDALYLYFVVP